MTTADDDSENSGDSGDRVELGDQSDIADGEMRCFEEVGPHGILLCRVDGTLHAIEDNCSHADTPLSEGRFRGAKVTCPLHGAQFDVRDGSHSGPPAWEGVASYPVDESDAGVVVTLRDQRIDDRDPGFGGAGGIVRTR